MLTFNFNPFPTIQTERLVLRQFTSSDAEDYFLLRSCKDTMKYIDKPLHKTVDETKQLIEDITKRINTNEAVVWAITLKGEDKMIGTISYHNIYPEHHRAEIGYLLSPQHWRKGILSEAIKAVIEFGFEEMKLHSMEAIINPLNDASRNLLKKFNFVQEAYFKENYFSNGKFLDTEIYSLLDSSTI